MAAVAALRMYELRWVSGCKEGVCWIRALDEDDAIGEFQRDPSWYGAPHDRALAVTALPVRRVEARLSGRL